jgi:hypothetical protein
LYQAIDEDDNDVSSHWWHLGDDGVQNIMQRCSPGIISI